MLDVQTHLSTWDVNIKNFEKTWLVKPSKDHRGGDKEEHCILPARRIAAGPDIHYT